MNRIVSYMHCARCLKSVPHGESPSSYARLSVGWTPKGFQVWCERHQINVAAYDLRGQKIAYDKGAA